MSPPSELLTIGRAPATAARTRAFQRVLRDPRQALAVLRGRLWARLWLRRCTSLGQGVRLRGRPVLFNQGTIVIGERTRIESITARSELAAFKGGRLEIGARVYINYGASIAARRLVRIGDGCALGTHAILMDNDFHGVEDRDHLPPSEPIILEDNVWLGARVIVLKGVTIGHDSVIGAGSVVTRNIPPRSVAAGVPARVLRTF